MNLKKGLLPMLGVFAAFAGYSQQIQLIHNSPDPAVAVVDVYVNGTKALDDVSFRDNSRFIALPAVGPVSIGIKDKDAASTDADLLTIPYTPTVGVSEILVASGMVDVTKYATNPDGKSIAVGVIPVSNARTEAVDNSKVALNVFHGSTDAPTVDVVIRGTALAFDDLAYGESTAYIEVDPGKYIIDVYTADRTTVVATFEADLDGLDGEAITVYASGFLTPSNNENGPAFGLYAAVQPSGTNLISSGIALPAITTAMVQIIHNAADPSAAEVDIYLDGVAVGPLDNFAFRTATGFIELPANQEIVIGVAPGTSVDADDILATFPFTLMAGEMYTVVANGVLDPSTFASNPDSRVTGFNLWAAVAKTATDDETKTGLRIIHGATDAPTVDLSVRGAGITLVDNAAYGDITDYLEVDPLEYRLDVTDASGTVTVHTIDLDGEGAEGQVGVVLASGFLDSTANKSGRSFSLIGVNIDGEVFTLPAVTTAKAQIIHNAADPAAATVDVYLNGVLVDALDDFAFRTASSYIDLPANRAIKIGIAPGNSTSYSDTLATFNFNLLAGETYSVIANGVVGTGFDANPDGEEIGFGLWATSAKMMADDDSKVEFKIVHGATDAPTVDVVVDGAMLTLADDASYGAITDYIAVDASSYTLNVNTSSDDALVAAYTANLTGLEGNTAMVLASGFLNGENENQASNSFGLYAVLPAGGPFVMFDMIVGMDQPEDVSAQMNLFPNPANNMLQMSVSDDVILEYELVSMNGQIVKESNNMAAQNIGVDVSALEQGYYLMSVITEKGTAKQKVLITK